MDLADKVVLVTGAGSGLGAATSLACARAGARLHLVDRDGEGLRETAAKAAELGAECATLLGELTVRQFCRDSVKAAIDQFGRLDALCNIAGITLFHRVGEVTEEDWDKTLAIILSAPFFLSQAALPELIRTHGSILNVAGSGAIKGTS